MVKFRYIGDSERVTVGIAGATFTKGQIEEVPDERLAAKLRANEFFEEVSVDDVPKYPSAVSMMPDQGSPHHDSRVAAILTGTSENADVPVGNLSRDDQYEANLRELTTQEQDKDASLQEAASKAASKGQDAAKSDPAPAPAPEPAPLLDPAPAPKSKK